MRRSSVITTIALGAAVTASDAEAKLDLYVDKSAQRISVIQNGALLYVWPVSTGGDRFSTPNGVYTPERLERNWFSRAYYNSPMPYAIFFHNGYAIHGSYDISRLGGPASHGCVRLHPRDAALLFSMVEQEGPGGTTIFVGGTSPASRDRQFDDASRPPYRGGPPMARGPYPPEPMMPPPRDGADRYADGPEGYPPPPRPMSPYYPDGYVDRRGAYPAGPNRAPHYDPDHAAEGRGAPRGQRVPYNEGDRSAAGGGGPHGSRAARDYDLDPYVSGRGAPHGPRVARDYDVDPYAGGRGAPHGPRIARDYDLDPYASGRGAPHGPRIVRDDDLDPYVDGRGAPRIPGVPPDYDADRRGVSRRANAAAPFYPSDRPVDGRGGYPRGATPYYDGDRDVDGPGRRRGDRLTMRGNYPAGRPPVPRFDGEMPVGRAPRSSAAAGAKSKPGRLANEPSGRHANGGEAAKALVPPAPVPAPGPAPLAQSPAPLPPPMAVAPVPMPAAASWPPVTPPAPVPPAKSDASAEQDQPSLGYKVLPRSYWAGASWRWRMKKEDDSGPHDSQ